MNSLSELFKFVSCWSKYPKFQGLPNGSRFFDANIIYEFGGQNIEDETSVIIEINGFNSGKVSIYEKGVFNADLFHLDFLPKFQKYKFDSRKHVLIIEGDAEKMHGAFKVTVNPLV